MMLKRLQLHSLFPNTERPCFLPATISAVRFHGFDEGLGTDVMKSCVFQTSSLQTEHEPHHLLP
jgi:hypothetical protein